MGKSKLTSFIQINSFILSNNNINDIHNFIVSMTNGCTNRSWVQSNGIWRLFFFYNLYLKKMQKILNQLT